MQRGIVRWFNNSNGYGYVGSPLGDVMVHWSVIQSDDEYKSLRTNDEVMYEAEQTPKGLRATYCQRIGSDEPAVAPAGQRV